jgi:hypothetical protein
MRRSSANAPQGARIANGDEHAGEKDGLAVRAPAPRPDRYGGKLDDPLAATRQALMLAALVHANVPHRNVRGERRDQGRARESVHPAPLSPGTTRRNVRAHRNERWR